MKLYTANDYIRDTFGEKLYKISLNAGTTCPNRDGTVGIGGCIFCSTSGSGDFSENAELDINSQIERAKMRIAGKCRCKRFIAYFQSFTNTYGDPETLRRKFLAAAKRDDIAAVSIASRPDCFGPEILEIINEVRTIKPVWIELGLQTSNDRTAKLINRCYTLDEYDKTMNNLKRLDVHVVVHMIIGLPGETKQDMISTVRYIADSGADGIKLQLLHVLKNTVLEKMYINGEFDVLTFEEYADILCDCLMELPPDMVVHRFTGDGPKKILVAPMWSADKKMVLNRLNRIVSDL